jgi:hypothetical protein
MKLHGRTRFKKLYHKTSFSKVQIVTAENMESLIKESTEFRKKVRGVAVGRLG